MKGKDEKGRRLKGKMLMVEGDIKETEGMEGKDIKGK